MIKKTMLLLFILVMTFTFISCNKGAASGNDTDKTGNDTAVKSEAQAAASKAFYNCSIIDGTGAELISDGVILVKGDKLEQVGSSEEVEIPEGYEKIDLKGNTVLPGFINTHVHSAYDETNLRNWLSGGVTTVRDLSASISSAVKLRDAFNERADVTRIVSASTMMTVPEGYGHVYYNSVQEAKQLVNDFISEGYDVIKFSMEDYEMARSWPIGTLEEWQAIVDAAHAGGKRAVVHISHPEFLLQAAEIGVDEIAHMVTEPIDEEVCKAMIDKNIYWIPTLELWKGVSKLHSINYDTVTIKNLGIWYKAGGKIALGSDFAGYICDFDAGFPITEVALMKEAGMTNMDIILAGTKNAAECCDRADLGTLEAGKIADLLVVEGKPLEQLEDLQNTYMVIHNGEIAFHK